MATTATAAEHVHTLAEGETLGSLASQYYGAAWKQVYIENHNKLAPGRELAAGTRLKIPAASTYRVRRGDSFAEIARRFLGDRARYKALMQENGIRDAAALEVGSELLLPLQLRHTVEAGESLAKISQRYYRTTRRASLLKEYNNAPDNPSPKTRLLVPIFDRAALDPAARKPKPTLAARATATSPEVKVELTAAIDEYLQGDFELARIRLEKLLAKGDMALTDRATIVNYLGFCAAAEGDRKAALDYFKTWRELDPKAQPDPITTSPKILALFAEAVETETSEGEP